MAKESTCKHCSTPDNPKRIRLVKAHPQDPGQWYHIDGHSAYIECKHLKAEPISTGDDE